MTFTQGPGGIKKRGGRTGTLICPQNLPGKERETHVEAIFTMPTEVWQGHHHAVPVLPNKREGGGGGFPPRRKQRSAQPSKHPSQKEKKHKGEQKKLTGKGGGEGTK